MRTDDFDFELPDDLIALEPVSPRDDARLLVVRPGAATPLADRSVGDLPLLLNKGDVLVFNDTRVIPAALDGVRRRASGAHARVQVNLVRRLAPERWQAFARPAKRLEIGDRIRFAEAPNASCLVGSLDATVAAKTDGGLIELAFDLTGDVLDASISNVGMMPLPPYIAARRPATDADRTAYQTMFAAKDGAVAAPTAALHFTPRLVARCVDAGIEAETLTLHVGAGTFLPVKANETSEHVMHAEWGELTPETATRLNAARERGGRIVAVGTTVLRLLETAAREDGSLAPFSGETAIFITPGYRFKAVDVLMTNFHLPRSTLFMLVAAFSGLDVMRAAYAHAMDQRYRFYSYGDASLLFLGPVYGPTP
ncbi:MAG: tRNA preQ1(34) S-adenosylmethionine ribosyltransferase-isomerase QueA [Hyphomicrobiaceae bacterium]